MHPPNGLRVPRDKWFGILDVTLSATALQLNISVLLLLIVSNMSGTLTQVGILSGVAAAIEVPVIIGWGCLALRWRKERILGISSAVFAACFVSVVFTGSFVELLALQVLAAIAIAAILSINISYLQEAIPGWVGLSTSLVDVTTIAASLTAAAIFALNPWEGYALLMMVATAISLIGVGAFVVARRLSA